MNWIRELERLWVPIRGHRVKTMSDEWKLARRGRLTASSRARSIAGPRAVGNFPRLKEKILHELSDDYVWTETSLPAINWGNDHERQALSSLELELGLEPEESYEPGFMLHPRRPYAGCTPDLIIEGIETEWRAKNPYECQPVARRSLTAVQVKCPYNSQIHVEFLHRRKIWDDTYMYQIQWEGWVAGAEKLLFVSFDPCQRIVDRRLAYVDIPVDEKLRKLFDTRCDMFHEFMDRDVATPRGMDIDSLASQF